jgi:hypothetical protein
MEVGEFRCICALPRDASFAAFSKFNLSLYIYQTVRGINSIQLKKTIQNLDTGKPNSATS